MTTNVEYALLAANSYAVKPAVTSDANVIPIPNGWALLKSKIDDATGFTARAYRNTQTGELTIAYTGTTFEGAVNNVGDWLLGNLTAGSGAVLAPQVTDAAKFYLDVLQTNPGANITFTGHSLGGGLASLMAVYFDRQAVVFDEAPFRKSADSAIVANGLKLVLAAAGYTLPDAFTGYIALDPLTGAIVPSPTRVAREGNVSAIYIKDEILSLAQTATGRIVLPLLVAWNPALFALSLNVANIAGSQQVIDAHATNGNGWGVPLLNGDPIDLHYMPLLTAFLQSPEFLAVSQSNPEVLQKIFTSVLSVNPSDARRNFLNLMVQRQTLNENPLGAFAGDIGRITGDIATSTLKAALVDLGIDLQYVQGLDHVNGIAGGVFEPVFKPLTGGMQIEHKPVDDQWVAKGFVQLDMELRKAHRELVAGSIDRYSLATQGDLIVAAPDDQKRDFMLGGAGSDTLSGGTGNDLLIGGAGNDTLNGGAGYDIYLIEGSDTIQDSDGSGILKDQNGTPISGVIEKHTDGTYTFVSDASISVSKDTDLTLTFADGTVAVIQNFQDGALGLRLVETAAITPARTLTGDLNPIDFDLATPEENLGYDALGNVIVSLTAAPGRADTLYGSAGNDLIRGLGGDDFLVGRGGADRLEGGSGRDLIDGGDGDDLLVGNSEADLLGGGDGDDRLFADAEIELTDVDLQTGGSGRELLVGGDGNDTLVGAATADALLGGVGDDLLLGGAGDDDLLGDRHVTAAGNATARDWTLTRSITVDGGITHYRHTWLGFSSGGEAAEGGADVLYGGAGNDWIMAGAGDDLLDGGADADVLFGQGGNDVLDGGSGDDVLNGDEIDEGTPGSLAGALHGSDYLDGGDGADQLAGNGGADELFGGAGDDQLAGDDGITPGQYHGADYLDGEDGNDRLWGYGGGDTLFGGAGNDHLEGDYSTLAGQYHGADTLDGEAGDDELIGGGGNDTLIGGAGDDVLNGDDSLDAPLAATWHGNDTLDGGDGRDSLYGNGGDDILLGGVGNDDLHGDAGNDTLTGGAGTDNLYGGAGDDTYVLAAGDGASGPNGEVEFIEDASGRDTLRLDGIAPAQLNVYAANGDWLVIDYAPQEVPLGDGVADRVAIINGMGGAIERIAVGGETLTYAQFVGRHAESRRWRDGVQSNINNNATNEGEFVWVA